MLIMETSRRSRTFVIRVVVPLLLLSLSVLRGADAVAMKTTLFYDDACEEDVGVSVTIFYRFLLFSAGGSESRNLYHRYTR